MKSNRPKILHITRGTGKAGIERIIIAITKALSDRFDFGHLGLFGSGLVDEKFQEMGIETLCAEITEKKLIYYPLYFRSVNRLSKIISNFGADIVHLYHPPHQYWVGKAAHRAGAKLVLEACNANIYRREKLAAFVDGGANMLSTIGIPLKMAVGVMAVLVSSFAATTMDTATRLQRYVITELGNAVKIKPLTNRYVATLAAVVTAAVLAMIPAHGKGPGTGGLILWPLFGCTNQILAGLVFMVLLFYLLLKRGRIAVYVLLPMIVMLILPAWAMVKQIIKWSAQPAGHWHLIVFGVVTLALMVWFVLEGVLMWRQHRGGRLPYQPA